MPCRAKMWEKAGAMAGESGEPQGKCYEKLTKACKCDKAGSCPAPTMKGSDGEQPRAKGFSDVVREALAKAGAKPPAGYTPVPGGKHGGYRKKVGNRWFYWYPDKESAQGAHKRHSRMAEAAKRKHAHQAAMGEHEEAEKHRRAHEESAQHAKGAKAYATGWGKLSFVEAGGKSRTPPGVTAPEHARQKMGKGATVGYPTQGVPSSGPYAPLVPSNLSASPEDEKRDRAESEGALGKAEWSTAYVNDLPDSAFLHVAAGGRKDPQGKTVPRSLRKFPVRGGDGKFDPPHVRNAISRAPQAEGMSSEEKGRVQRKARAILKRIGDSAE